MRVLASTVTTCNPVGKPIEQNKASAQLYTLSSNAFYDLHLQKIHKTSSNTYYTRCKYSLEPEIIE